MTDQPSSQYTSSQLLQATSVVIVLPQHPVFEQVACGLSLLLALERSERNVEIVCVSEMLVEANRLVGVQKVKTELSGRNLVISFDYIKDAIEKVSYNVEKGKFNLVVVPKSGSRPLDPASVVYSHSGTNGDLFVLIGSQDTKEIQQILPDGEQANDKQILSLISGPDRSLSSETALLISSINLTPDSDAANNLFMGLLSETHQFQHASAIDFETAGALIRMGATAPVVQQIEEKNSDVPITHEDIAPIKSDWLKPKIFSTKAEN